MEYFVEYIDEFGTQQSEVWNQGTLDYELTAQVVKITHIEYSYNTQKKLGLVED